MLFLVEGEIRICPYGNEATIEKAIRLVEAVSEEEAKIKFINYWDNFTKEFDVYYSARVLEINSVIT